MRKEKVTESAKSAAKNPSWDEIGSTIGKKVDNECKKNPDWWECDKCNRSCCGDHGFFGRAVFIIAVLVALNQLGYTADLSIWVQIFIGVGFSLMQF